jgi:hypothetical protein
MGCEARRSPDETTLDSFDSKKFMPSSVHLSRQGIFKEMTETNFLLLLEKLRSSSLVSTSTTASKQASKQQSTTTTNQTTNKNRMQK